MFKSEVWNGSVSLRVNVNVTCLQVSFRSEVPQFIRQGSGVFRVIKAITLWSFLRLIIFLKDQKVLPTLPFITWLHFLHIQVFDYSKIVVPFFRLFYLMASKQQNIYPFDLTVTFWTRFQDLLKERHCR